MKCKNSCPVDRDTEGVGILAHRGNPQCGKQFLSTPWTKFVIVSYLFRLYSLIFYI